MTTHIYHFAYQLGQTVVLTRSLEQGEIIGRANYTNSCDQYKIRYVAADGRQVESWWDEDAITAL